MVNSHEEEVATLKKKLETENQNYKKLSEVNMFHFIKHSAREICLFTEEILVEVVVS